MTVTELARLAEVSTGLISQVERELSDPSLATIRKIARALDSPLFSLFEEPETDDIAVVRRDSRMTVQSPGGIAYSRISAGRGRLEVLQGTLSAGAALGSVQTVSSAGQQAYLAQLDVGSDGHAAATWSSGGKLIKAAFGP